MTFNKWLTALTLISVGLAAQAQKTPTGSYVYEGGNGELRIQTNGSFTIDTVGGNGHICYLEGEIKGKRARLPDGECVVTFTLEGNNIRVTDNEHKDCRDSCGARAGYTGLYIHPSPACTFKGMTITRRKFKTQYDRKEFSTAVQTLSPVLTDCAAVLNRFREGDLRNDLALAQLHSGDAAACLNTLQPLQDLGSMSDEEVRETSVPFDVDLNIQLARKTRTNLKLCNAVAH